MRLLRLCGTEFVGRAVAETALGRGWDVTVFHRGRHRPPPGVRSPHGDRTAPDGLAAPADGGGTGDGGWDAVVDTWSAAPRAVRDPARPLRGRAGRYVYVSSCSVYAWPRGAGYTEDAPLVPGAAADAGQTDYARDKRGGQPAAVETFSAEHSLRDDGAAAPEPADRRDRPEAGAGGTPPGVYLGPPLTGRPAPVTPFAPSARLTA